MKRIVVNGRFLIHRITGVERYAHEILWELDKIIKPGEVELAIPPGVEIVPTFKNILIKRVGRLHNILWEHISFPLYVLANKSIPLNLCNVAPLIYPGIATIFDMKIKVHPEFFSKKFVYWYSILFWNIAHRSKCIITDSYATKKDILYYYPFLKEDKIKVIYPGWQHYKKIKYDEETLNKYCLDKNKYYFSMCSLEPNKNFKWIAEVAKKQNDQIFAVAGSINKRVFADGMGFECPENMKLLGYVSDEEAKTLMRDSKGFLFPTIYEGFGIPPLEAMVAGAKRIYVTNSEVMHEVFDNSVHYLALNKYEIPMEDDQLENVRIVLQKFSWEKSAEDIYNTILKD